MTIADVPLNAAASGTDTLTSLEGPTGSGFDYAARIRGYLVPPVSGSYRFWIASDDQAELWLSASADPRDTVLIASTTTPVLPREWNKQPTQRSAAIFLVAGSRYSIEVLHKQGSGGDSLAVGWLKPGEVGSQPSEIVPGSALAPLPSPPGPVITVQPFDASVESIGWQPTFIVEARGRGPLSYQWRRNEAPIAGAQSAAYAFVVGPADHGARYDCVISDSSGSVVSTAATLRIIALANAPGSVVREYWLGVPGSAVTDIPVDRQPTGASLLTALQGPTDAGKNYATRVRGYLLPPVAGTYTFWVAGDDSCELWLSTSADPAGKVRVARVSEGGWFADYQWHKDPSQRSAPITLRAGERYYLEVLHKQSTGGDSWAVGWLQPGETGDRPSGFVPGSALAPFIDR